MKKLYLTFALAFSLAVSAQQNSPKSTLVGPVTGTENITGAPRATIPAPANPDVVHTTATGATGIQNVQVQTQYGKNNDGSSTGTTATGTGAANNSLRDDDNAPSPSNKAGSWIITPRGRK